MTIHRLHDAEALHDLFVALGKLYAVVPTEPLRERVLAAHREFYFAFVGSWDGFPEAQADLLQKMRARAA